MKWGQDPKGWSVKVTSQEWQWGCCRGESSQAAWKSSQISMGFKCVLWVPLDSQRSLIGGKSYSWHIMFVL